MKLFFLFSKIIYPSVIFLKAEFSPLLLGDFAIRQITLLDIFKM